jgi:hypothetical protein
MGKLKALLIDKQEQEDNQGLDDMEEAHYHHVINDFVSLIEVHGWSNVILDLREAMGKKTWQ